MSVLDESRHDFGVESSLENGTLFLQLLAKGFGIQEIAVMCDGARTELRVVKCAPASISPPAARSGRHRT